MHIGADFLSCEESWGNLTEIWGNTEKILYTISNRVGETPRRDIPAYAKPISGILEQLLENGTIELKTEDDLKEFVKKAQNNGYRADRYYGINFSNVGSEKNTIEFRLANGTIDADIWIENINLFGGIIKASEDIASMQKKSEKDLTDEEHNVLGNFLKIKNNEVNDRDKLEALLKIIIPEEDRGIYRERYDVNSKLIEQNPRIEKEITEHLAHEQINIKKVTRKVFAEEDSITGQEYDIGVQMIELDLQRANSDIIL